MKSDGIGTKILRELTRDGRIANTQLAERVGLSPSACLRRVQEMERAGIITGYRAVLDPLAMGRGFVAYVTVGLAEHTKAAQQRFEQAVEYFRDSHTGEHGGVAGHQDRVAPERLDPQSQLPEQLLMLHGGRSFRRRKVHRLGNQ